MLWDNCPPKKRIVRDPDQESGITPSHPSIPTFQVLLVSETEAGDAGVRPRHHVVKVHLALLVAPQLDGVVLLQRVAEGVVDRGQQPVLPLELDVARGGGSRLWVLVNGLVNRSAYWNHELGQICYIHGSSNEY